MEQDTDLGHSRRSDRIGGVMVNIKAWQASNCDVFDTSYCKKLPTICMFAADHQVNTFAFSLRPTRLRSECFEKGKVI